MPKCFHCDKRTDDILQCRDCTFSGCEACFDHHFDNHGCPGYLPDRLRRRIEALRSNGEKDVLLDALLVAVSAIEDFIPERGTEEALEKMGQILGEKLLSKPGSESGDSAAGPESDR